MNKENEKYLIDDSVSLTEALKKLNETGRRIVFLINNGKLSATLTYGDVSRWILQGGSLDSPAYDAARKDPIFVRRENIADVDSLFKDNNDRRVIALPIIDKDNNVVDIIFRDKDITAHYEKVEVPVVMMAGGKGTRLYPYTKILPKPLIPIGETPISEHIVNRFYLNGCTQFYFIVNYKKNMIKAYYNEIERPYKIHFVDEDIMLGTGGGLSLMKGLISSTFILTNCDSFIEEDFSKIIKIHKEKDNIITMVCSNKRYEIPYGVIEINSDRSLKSMREKPSIFYLVNTGTYIVESKVIDMISPNKPIGFPDVVQMAKDKGHNVGIYTVDGSKWFDMGQFDNMHDMKKRLNIKD